MNFDFWYTVTKKILFKKTQKGAITLVTKGLKRQFMNKAKALKYTDFQ